MIENNTVNNLKELKSKLDVFNFRKESLEKEIKQLYTEIETNKTWVAYQPNRLDFVEKLQQYQQQQNVLSFNNTLSAFVEDVLEKDKKIEFELFISHSLPALKMHALNNGEKESILYGSGGSLANIVSTGLRIIAAARSKSRNFLILDEADCWIKPERIELFAQVIGSISQKLNMQIIMISHHSAKFFEKYGRVIELKKNGNKVVSSIVSDTPFDPSQKFISKVRMQNLMSHEDTTLELHPNITCIIGENDLGKSVVNVAFNCVARNNSEDGFVKHKKDFASVTIDFDNEYQVYWQRNIKTSSVKDRCHQKVYFELIQNNNVLHQIYQSDDCPKVIEDVLNIKEIDNIDIHLTSQKEPTFLIDSKTKPVDKAKILSLGQDSLVILKTMEKIKEKAKVVSKKVKEDEIIYHTKTRIINQFENLDTLNFKYTDISTMIDTYQVNDHYLNQLSTIIDEISSLEKISNNTIINNININDYVIENTIGLDFIIKNISLNSLLSNLNAISLGNFNQSLEDFSQINNSINNISIYTNHSKLSNIQLGNFDSSIEDTIQLNNSISNLDKLDKLSVINNILLGEFNQNIISNDSINSLIKALNENINYSLLNEINLTDINHLHIDNTNTLSSVITDLNSLESITSVQPCKSINIIDIVDESSSLTKNINNIDLAIKYLEEQEKELIMLNTDLEKNNHLLTENNNQLKDLVSQLDNICPCCGTTIDPEQLINHSLKHSN